MFLDRLLFGLSLTVVVLVGLLTVAAQAEEPTWKAATARAKITPTEPLCVGGWGGYNRNAEGTIHDIWTQVLALEASDGHRAVVITADVMGFSKVMYDGICAELRRRCGMDRSQVKLAYSHTHTGPALRELLQDYYPMDQDQRARVEQYSLALEKTIVNKTVEALSRMTPVRIWTGEGSTDFAVNRRENPEGEVPKMRSSGQPLKGPVDHGVPVLAVRTPEGRLRAVLFGYACHLTTIRLFQWSNDYAGFARIVLEENHPGTEAMFFAACGADQNPLPRGSVELGRKYGNMLAESVEQVLREPMKPVDPKLQTAFDFVDLDYHRTMTREDLQGYVRKGGIYGRWARRMLKQLDEGNTFPTSYPYAVQVWKLGTDQLWISLGGEVVVDYSVKFKTIHGPQTWASGFAHDLTAYVPSRRVWKEGGYEGGALGEYGLPAMRWASDVEERITAGVGRLVEKLK